MELLDFVERYALGRTLCDKYVAALRCTARQVAFVHGGSAPLKELRALTINTWLAAVEKKSPTTAANKRRHIHTLCAAAGVTIQEGNLRRVRVPRQIPEALTMDQLGELLAAADRLKGFFKGTAVPRRTYWRSLLMAGWDSALRISDLRSIERPWIWAGGYISIVQHKTGYSHRVQFRPATLEQIDLLLAGRTLGPIWSTLTKKNFYANLKRLAASAGVKANFKMVRRASASYVELARPGMGWRHLGHVRPGLAERSYLDPRICSPEPSLPPPVDRLP